jgi:hypothetical protein
MFPVFGRTKVSRMGNFEGTFQKFNKKKGGGFKDDYDSGRNRRKNKKWKRNPSRNKEGGFSELDRPDSQPTRDDRF